MEKIRVGIIGAGWVARNRHLPALRQIPNVEIHSIWSRSAEKARAAASEFDIPHLASEWQEIASSKDLDAVVIATPPALHLPATAAALEAGKNVLCQARLARNLREAREMVRLARASRLVTALYPPRPGLKGDRVMQRLLGEEKIVGEIREVRVVGMSLAERKESYDWTIDPDVVGVNAMTLGMWAEVLNRWVGPAVRVAAWGKTHHRQRKTLAGEWVEAAVPDSLAVVADLECGATASYHFSTCAAGLPGQAIEIYGPAGALAYQFFSEEIRGLAPGGSEWRPIAIPPEEERTQSTDVEFIRAIIEGGRVEPDFDEGLKYMEFCEAVALSLKTGRAVDLFSLQAEMDAWGRMHDTGSPA